MGIVAGTVQFGTFDWTGNFTSLDLLAAAMSALNGALLCRRPDHFKRFTVVGVLLLALLGGIGSGITRDVLVRDVPGSGCTGGRRPARLGLVQAGRTVAAVP
jgi:hypothetical protein